MRPRFTITSEKWKRACEYAEATNRTPSELVAEALEQIQARYPKRRKENEIDVIAVKVAAILREGKVANEQLEGIGLPSTRKVGSEGLVREGRLHKEAGSVQM